MRRTFGMMHRSRADVTVCIPAWMAEDFIGSTLRFASGQTYSRIRIVVSVDSSTDRTAQICRDYAKGDPRISVFEQTERLGWAGNVNFLLDQVDTPYYFLYFHDDVLLPQYTATLLRHLEDDRAAMSAHCDMGHHGGSHHVSVGRPYLGTTATRLMTFLLAPERGSPLRSLTRSTVLDGVRMPTDAVDGLWANEPYLMRLLSAGPAVHVPEVLYLRWTERAGGLTDGWGRLTPQQLLEGFKTNIAILLDVAAAVTPGEREALTQAVLLHMLPRLRAIERESGVTLFETPAELHAAFGDLGTAVSFDMFDPEIQEWVSQRQAEVLRLEESRASLTPAVRQPWSVL